MTLQSKKNDNYLKTQSKHYTHWEERTPRVTLIFIF